MFRASESAAIQNSSLQSNRLKVRRLTAIWGFSEAAFGGILHAFKIPLTGLFVGGAAVILISLIAHFSEKKNEILKSTLIVILVKAVVSPHTPLNAYIAVSLEGILGYSIFSVIRHEKTAAVMLGFLALFLSSLQKILVLTLLFGNSLWESIDEFAGFIAKEIHISGNSFNMSISFILIGIYSSVHIAGGIYAGIVAGRIPEWIRSKENEGGRLKIEFENGADFYGDEKKRKRKPWYARKSGMILLSVLFIIMIASYFFPVLGRDRAYSILLMIIRAFTITFVWFVVFSPFVVKFVRRILERKKSGHSAELEYIVNLFPGFRRVISYSWKSTYDIGGWKRFRKFLSTSFMLLLFMDDV